MITCRNDACAHCQPDHQCARIVAGGAIELGRDGQCLTMQPVREPWGICDIWHCEQPADQWCQHCQNPPRKLCNKHTTWVPDGTINFRGEKMYAPYCEVCIVSYVHRKMKLNRGQRT